LRRSPRSANPGSAGAEEAQHLAVLGPAPHVLLREDDLAVAHDVELGLRAFARRRLDPALVQLGRETRGPFVVSASDGAIEDLDRHAERVAGEDPRRFGAFRDAILDAMNADDLEKLRAAGSAIAFSSGQVLIERGKPGTGLYVVVEGDLVVEAPEGTRELVPGAVVGERALLSADGMRTARVRALTDGVVVAVERAEIDRLCAADPEFAERLAEVS
jgi:hypothetical protein